MIDHGADVNATNKHNNTALNCACYMGYTDSVKVLLKAGVNPSIVNADGDTCLHTAVRQGCSIDVLYAIIDHDVHVSATNNFENTALSYACSRCNSDAIKVLLYGLLVLIQQYLMSTVIHLSTMQSLEVVIKILYR